MTKRVTIHDVAARAGVSHQTVSRVINQHALVSEAARARVLQAMRELDYSPNAAARSLAAGRSRLLGVLLADVYNPFWGAILHGIEDMAYDAGYSVITCNIGVYDPQRESIYVRVLREQRVAGVVVGGGGGLRDLQSLTQSGIQVASVDQRRPGVDSVLLDNAAAAALAVDHLLGLGHRRIGLITGQLAHDSGRGRLVGYRRALRRAGIPPVRDLQAAVPYTEVAAVEAAQSMLSRTDRPTALIAASNDLAIGALRAAASLGLRIPDDLALVGFDELTWTSSLLSTITTVVQPGRALGSAACRLVLDRLGGRYSGPPRRLLLPARLIVSLSSGARARRQDWNPTIPESVSLLHPLPLLVGADAESTATREQAGSVGSSAQRK